MSQPKLVLVGGNGFWGRHLASCSPAIVHQAITNNHLALDEVRWDAHRLGLWAQALKIGACALHTETELILKSRKVYLKRLLAAGFQFEYETCEAAVGKLFRAVSSSQNTAEHCALTLRNPARKID